MHFLIHRLICRFICRLICRLVYPLIQHLPADLHKIRAQASRRTDRRPQTPPMPDLDMQRLAVDKGDASAEFFDRLAACQSHGQTLDAEADADPGIEDTPLAVQEMGSERAGSHFQSVDFNIYSGTCLLYTSRCV